MRDRYPIERKCSLETERKETKQYFISTKCNKIGCKKRKNCDFYEIKVENNGRKFHHRLKKHYFNTFPAKGFSEARPMMHLCKHVFWGQ